MCNRWNFTDYCHNPPNSSYNNAVESTKSEDLKQISKKNYFNVDHVDLVALVQMNHTVNMEVNITPC